MCLVSVYVLGEWYSDKDIISSIRQCVVMSFMYLHMYMYYKSFILKVILWSVWVVHLFEIICLCWDCFEFLSWLLPLIDMACCFVSHCRDLSFCWVNDSEPKLKLSERIVLWGQVILITYQHQCLSTPCCDCIILSQPSTNWHKYRLWHQIWRKTSNPPK